MLKNNDNNNNNINYYNIINNNIHSLRVGKQLFKQHFTQLSDILHHFEIVSF